MANVVITLSQFCNFITKTGVHRYNAVKSIYRDLHSDYTIGTDYWAMLRNHIKYVLNHSGKAEELDVVLDRVSEDKRANYSQKIGGLKKFWKKRKLEKLILSKKFWKHKDLRVNVAPELCFTYREQAYAIKLFFSSGDKKISKNEADVLLELMREAYSVDTDEVKIGILDLPRGKVFYYNNTLPEISMLVKSEAESLLKMLSSLEG